jgi:hypothetical protein
MNSHRSDDSPDRSLHDSPKPLEAKRRGGRRRKAGPIADPTPPMSEAPPQADMSAPPPTSDEPAPFADEAPSASVLAALIRSGGDAPAFDAQVFGAESSPPASEEAPRVVAVERPAVAETPTVAEMPTHVATPSIADDSPPWSEAPRVVDVAPPVMDSTPAYAVTSPSAAEEPPPMVAAADKPAASSGWMVAVVAIVVGSVFGVYAANTYKDGAEKTAQAQARPEDNSLAAQVRELAKQVEALRLQLAAPAQPAPAPAPAPQSGPDVAELRTAVEALTAALLDMPVAAADESYLVVPAFDSTRRSKLEQQLNHDDAGLRDRHLFWTDQELLDAYGAPDFISVQDGVEQWTYSFPSGAAGFAMHMRRVIEVFSS